MPGLSENSVGGRLNKLSRWPLDCVTGLLAAMISIAAYLFVGHIGRPSENVTKEGERLSDIVKTHDGRMSLGLDKIAKALCDSCAADTLLALERVARNTSAEGGDYCYYVFRNGELRFWHNAMLPAASLTPGQIKTPMTVADNGFYYVRQRAEGECVICILLRVRSTFPYSNDYLNDEFEPSFRLPTTSGIAMSPTDGGVDVQAPGGRYLFTVMMPWATSLPCWAIWLSIASLITFTIAMLWAAGRYVREALRCGTGAIAAVARALPFYLTVYCVMLILTPPWSEDGLLMFSAYDFSYDWWLPSYWILASIAVCNLHCGYTLFRISDIDRFGIQRHGRMSAYATVGALTAICTASYIIANGMIETLVSHSRGLSFYAGEIDLSETSIVKISVIGAAVIAFIFTAERAVAVITSAAGTTARLVSLCAGTVITAVAGALALDAGGASIGIGFAVLCVAIYFTQKASARTIKFSHFVWLMLLTSGFTLMRMTQLNESKEHSYRQLLASNLSFQMVREDDPIAEQLLPQVYASMRSDTLLAELMAADDLSHDRLYTHIRNRYFNGYFSRYDLQVIPCRGSASTIQLTTSGDVADCVSYFDMLTSSIGRRLPDAHDFYCLYDGDSRPCYMAKLNFDHSARSASATPNRLYIQILLKSTPRTAGYPELLTNKRDIMSYGKMKGYSYAKYDKSRLTFHHGDFDYPANVRLTADGTAIMPSSSEASHYVLPAHNQQTVVVTYPRQSASNILTCFSYLFLGLLVVSTAIMVAASRSKLTFIGHMDIRERIHASLVFFIVAFFGVMCAISGSQAITGYEAINKRHLSQAMSSFYAALADELSNSTAAEIAASTSATAEVDYLLQRTSNATGADAHLFDVRGRLIGTSRRELFLSGITAPLMNTEALIAMRDGEQSETYIKEHIGSMLQYAAYTPLYNGGGEVLGYINVPLFDDVNAIRSQVISSIEPMTNSLVFIVILSIIASSALARVITKPLIGLRDMLKSVDLLSSDVKLVYPYDDEVGQVVAAYNKMNDTLRSQAERLAATERESTWREMARQIAHEIKNPLTPMKLSIQYLLKCWDSKRDNFEPMMRRTAQTLVDQIDQLSAVASQFSGIAKMKQAEPVVFDIAARLSATATMFGRTDEATICYSGPQNGVMIKADPDQMTSVFNNLIKNAQQSAADGRKVDIVIGLTAANGKATASVTDNGDGIPDEIRSKIFKPNFTTKGTGMGLGLAITKNIVDNSGGEISFKTQIGKGTTFTLTLPLCGEKETT